MSRALSSAQDLLRQQKWTEAVEAYQGLFRVYPSHIIIGIDLATAQVFRGNRLEGLSLLTQLWNRSSKTNQKEIENKFNLLSKLFLTNKDFELYQEALNLIDLKKYTQARAHLLSILSRESYHIDVILKGAQCLILEGKAEQAVVELTQVKQWSSFVPEISQWLGRAYLLSSSRSQSLQKALYELKLASLKIKESESLAVWLAQTYVKLGQFQQAIQVLERDVAVNPLHIVSLVKLAEIKLQIAKGEVSNLWSARKDLQLALSRFDQDQYTQVMKIYELTDDVRKKPEDLKGEIQELLQHIQIQLEELGVRR